MNKREPQPIIMPTSRKQSYSWAFRPTVADLPQTVAVLDASVSCCSVVYEKEDLYCDHCGQKLINVSFARSVNV